MNQPPLQPLCLAPKLVPAIWGGDALVQQYGKPGDPAALLGESWECWDENTVSNGPLAGTSLGALRARLGSALLGDLDAGASFPVLTKLIDARGSLSVQVHPDDAYAQRVELQPNGKTECWYILAAQPGAQIVLGWNVNTSREEYTRRVADGSLGEILRHVDVKAGDAFFLPAGTMHAIGAGVILFETQQASNLTYRIFDWNRVDAAGQPRELHVEKAADVVDFRACTAGAVEVLDYTLAGHRRTAVIADPRFVVERLDLTSSPCPLATDGRPLIVMALADAIELVCPAGNTPLGPFQTALVPAALGEFGLRAPDGRAQAMLVMLPVSADALQARLAAAEIGPERVAQFLRQFAPA